MRRLGPEDFQDAARVLLADGVREQLYRMTEAKVRQLLSRPGAYVLLPDPAVAFVGHRLVGLAYQVHQAALPEARGRRVIEAGRRAIEWMWQYSPALTLVGLTPATHRSALVVAAHVGFVRVGEIPGAYPWGEGAVVTAITRATRKGPDGGGQ